MLVHCFFQEVVSQNVLDSEYVHTEMLERALLIRNIHMQFCMYVRSRINAMTEAPNCAQRAPGD